MRLPGNGRADSVLRGVSFTRSFPPCRTVELVVMNRSGAPGNRESVSKSPVLQWPVPPERARQGMASAVNRSRALRAPSGWMVTEPVGTIRGPRSRPGPRRSLDPLRRSLRVAVVATLAVLGAALVALITVRAVGPGRDPGLHRSVPRHPEAARTPGALGGTPNTQPVSTSGPDSSPTTQLSPPPRATAPPVPATTPAAGAGSVPPGPEPVVTAIAPDGGPPGTTIVLSGQGFFSPNGAVQVTIGSVPAATSCATQESCIATLPALPLGTPSSVGVTVTTESGTSSPLAFSYQPAPTPSPAHASASDDVPLQPAGDAPLRQWRHPDQQA